MTAKKPQNTRNDIRTTSADKVVPKTIDWLWPPYLPRGFYTDFHGDGKVGKGALVTGHLVPELCRQGLRTLWLSGEDPPAEAIVPRLLAAGLSTRHLKLVHFVDAVDRTWRYDDGEEKVVESRFLLP
jgi:putative DNA primase/helicase